MNGFISPQKGDTRNDRPLLYTTDAFTLSYAIKLENKIKIVLGAFMTVYVWQDFKRKSDIAPCRVQCALPEFFFSQFGKS